MKQLKDFLVNLATDHRLAGAYAADPRGTMAKAGLSADEQATVLSGDAVALRAALGRPDNDCMSQIGRSIRDPKSGRTLNMAALMPLERTVILSRDVELEVAEGRFKLLKAGTEVTRHLPPPVGDTPLGPLPGLPPFPPPTLPRSTRVKKQAKRKAKSSAKAVRGAARVGRAKRGPKGSRRS